MERYSRHLDRIRPAESQEWLDECFMNRVHRKVRNDSTISIEVRYLPDDMSGAYIFKDGQRFSIRATNKLENSRTKRNNPLAIDYSLGSGEDNV